MESPVSKKRNSDQAFVSEKEEYTSDDSKEEEEVIVRGRPTHQSWNKCFVSHCQKYSDRYLKDLKDRSVIFIHTCASHRTMQEKYKKAKARNTEPCCSICYGLNKSYQIYLSATKDFYICKTCWNLQDNICTTSNVVSKSTKKARGEAQNVKRELWAAITKKKIPVSLEGDGSSIEEEIGESLEIISSPTVMSDEDNTEYKNMDTVDEESLFRTGFDFELRELIISSVERLFPRKTNQFLDEVIYTNVFATDTTQLLTTTQ